MIRVERVSADFAAYVVWDGPLPCGTVYRIGRRPRTWVAKRSTGEVVLRDGATRADAVEALTGVRP